MGSFQVGRLLKWYRQTHRALPWRETKDPYLIWLSEVILQQTRVDQGMPYYLRFVEHFPNVHVLATADETDVMRLWEGLGYYSRARNLHATAKLVSTVHGGVFPRTYSGLLVLKGIGPYTAAAIASIAFDEPVAAVDGNVIRVMARYHGIESAVDRPDVLRGIRTLAQDCMAPAGSGDINQALMELGATVCTPAQPLCQKCPVVEGCVARSIGKQTSIPIKQGKQKVTDRYIHWYMCVNGAGETLTRLRTGKDIWRGLHEFPNIDTIECTDAAQAVLQASEKGIIPEGKMVLRYEGIHLLTHRRIHYSITVLSVSSLQSEGYGCVPLAALGQMAFPRPLRNFLSDRFEGLHIEM
jgi:A/G-specific adenine glycosylase